MALGDRSPRREHADRTRTALLVAALKLFSANGYDKTTTDEIAANHKEDDDRYMTKPAKEM